MIKLLVIGDAVTPTGFSKVLHSITKYLPKEKYDICWIGINYYGDPHSYPYRIYPASAAGDILGIRRIKDILNSENPDLIFILNDAWVQTMYLDEIKKFYGDKPLPKIVTYTPVDAEDHDPDWYRHFDIVTPVAYTQFGKAEIEKAAPALAEKLRIIQHGVDKEDFYKIDLPKEELKKQIFPDREDFYKDSFIVFSGSRNQPRKRLELTMEAFAIFAEGKPANVKLYMHCGITDQAVHIFKLAKRFNIEGRLIVTNSASGVQKIPVEHLNKIYNATDVGINIGLGEGWCLPCMEHAVTGAPQVVADHSALHELYQDCGILVPTGMKYLLDNIMTTGYLVYPADAAMGLEALYQDRELYNLLSERSVTKFTSEFYSWEYISSQWDKLFDEVLND